MKNFSRLNQIDLGVRRVSCLVFLSLRDHLDPGAKLQPQQRMEVAQFQLMDLAGRTPYWLAVLAVSSIAVFAFGVRDSAKPHWLIYLWMSGILACLISYVIMVQWINRLSASPSYFEIRRAHLTWCGWLTVVAAVWLSGNGVMAPQPQPYGQTFILAQQTFVYMTILGQFITVMCFSPSVIAIISIIVVGNLLPFELHILNNLSKHNPNLSLLNTHIFFSGQLIVFLLVGWFFSVSQKGFYVRQVLLHHEQVHSESEKARAETERLRANNFISAVGHDLKQPLQATALRLRALKNRAAEFPTLRETIDELERQNVSLHELVEASFDLSRLNAGTWNVEVRETVLADLILNVLNDFAEYASQKKVALESAPVPQVLVRTDPDALGRVLRNLIGNAIKYTPARSDRGAGLVTISFQIEEKFVAVSISDNGIGIPTDRARDIFEPYVQLGNPSRDRTKGFGLGLSIVDRLIRLLEGHSVSLEPMDGRGSRFTVRVPFVARIPDELLQKKSDPETPSLVGLRVAIIEDFDSVRDAICERLIDLGCYVYEGSESDEVIVKIRECEDGICLPDFIVADYRLGEGIGPGAHTGVDAIKKLRYEFERNIPAIVWTAETSPDVLQLIALEGFQVISKGPRMFDELVGLLKRIYNEKAAAPT